MSDTPRTDEQINGKPCTRFECLVGDSLRDALVPSQFARQLERELNAANDRIMLLEEAGIVAIHEAVHGREQDALEIWKQAMEAKP